MGPTTVVEIPDPLREEFNPYIAIHRLNQKFAVYPARRHDWNFNGVLECNYFFEAAYYHLRWLIKNYECLIAEDKRLFEDDGELFKFGSRDAVEAEMCYFELDSLLYSTQAFTDRVRYLVKIFVPKRDLPKSFRDLIRVDSWIDRAVITLLRYYWRMHFRRARDLRDIVVHYATLCKNNQRTEIIKASEPRKMLLPDNQDARTWKEFSFEKQIEMVPYARDLFSATRVFYHTLLLYLDSFISGRADHEIIKTRLLSEYGDSTSS